MNSEKWFVIVLFLAFALCAETFYTAAFTQPLEIGVGPVDPDKYRIISFDFESNNSARLLIINDGVTTVTMKDLILVNGMNATLEPLGYPTASIPKESRAKFTVTLKDGNQFIPSVEYTFVIETTPTHGSYSYVTRPFYAELCYDNNGNRVYPDTYNPTT